MAESDTQGMVRRFQQVRQFLRQCVYDLGLMGAGSDYVKFIVLGRSRTGTNFLRSLLNAHSSVEAFGEVFRSRDSMDWDHIGSLRTDRMRRQWLDDPVSFVDRRVFRNYPKGTRAVGFKIFYYHAREGTWKAIWEYLREHREIRVIHMTRRNVLETHVSRKRAEMTDSWVDTSGRNSRKDPLVTLDFDECLADFERTRAMEEEKGKFFNQHPTLDITYEGLAGDYKAEMKRVFEFLGLDWEPVEPGTHKQTQTTLREGISNFAELQRKFAGSPWEEFFENGSRDDTTAG